MIRSPNSQNIQQFITQRFCYQCNLPSVQIGKMTRWRSPLWWVTGHNKLTGHRWVNHHHILLLHTHHTGQTHRSQERAWGTLDQQIQATITTPQPIRNLPRDKQQTLKPVITVNWTKQGRLLDFSLCNYDMCWFITGHRCLPRLSRYNDPE